jgi:uncharacterized protein
MTEEILIYLLLALSAGLAGAINSIAGGGTLLTFPALLSVIDPVFANATSTVALLPGSVAGAWGFRKELVEVRRMVLWLLVPSLIGGILGAILVTQFDPRYFSRLVPWLILVATLLFASQKPIAKWVGAHPQQEPKGITFTVILCCQFIIAVYGGYFGAGIGILMLSALGFMGIGSIHRMNAVKTILASTINLVAVTIFISEGQVVWKYAIVMAFTAVVGGYVGAKLSKKIPVFYIRATVIVIGIFAACYGFWKQTQVS